MELEHLSASRLETYEQCQLKYYAKYVLKLPDEPGDAANLGTAVHRAMELATNARIAGGSGKDIDPLFWLPDELLKFGLLAREKEAVEMINNGILWGYFRNLHKVKGCEVELKFNLPDGTPVVGFVDRLDLDFPTADIKDLKTGKRKFPDNELQKKWQGRIYNIGVRKMFPEVTDQCMVSYWVLRHQVQRAYYNAFDAENDEQELVEKCMEIVACDDPVPTPSGLCPWCPHVECHARRQPGSKLRKPSSWRKR